MPPLLTREIAASPQAVTAWLAVLVSRTCVDGPVTTSLTCSGISAARNTADIAAAGTNVSRPIDTSAVCSRRLRACDRRSVGEQAARHLRIHGLRPSRAGA